MTSCPDCADIKEVVGRLILWIAQSANSPLSHSEATELLMLLDRHTLLERKRASEKEPQ